MSIQIHLFIRDEEVVQTDVYNFGSNGEVAIRIGTDVTITLPSEVDAKYLLSSLLESVESLDQTERRWQSKKLDFHKGFVI